MFKIVKPSISLNVVMLNDYNFKTNTIVIAHKELSNSKMSVKLLKKSTKGYYFFVGLNNTNNTIYLSDFHCTPRIVIEEYLDKGYEVEVFESNQDFAKRLVELYD